jgi:putative SbcD/Mre11-related phosphoesterase
MSIRVTSKLEVNASSLRLLIPFPALLLRRGPERILVVGDLHIGWEVSLSKQGIHVPSQTGRLTAKLIELIKTSKPSMLIFLGDVKHTVAGAELEEWQDIPEFFESLLKFVPRIEVIQGNHDGGLEALTPREVRIYPPSGIAVWRRFGLLHGNAWPSTELLGCETLIMGHLHPVVSFTDPLGYRMIRPVWVKARCDGEKLARHLVKHQVGRLEGSAVSYLKDRFGIHLAVSRCLFIPPFNDLLGGQSVNSRLDEQGSRSKDAYIGPLTRSSVVDLENAEILMLDGTFLGTIKQLRSVA